MADIAHTKTDQKLEEMEKRLSAIYSRAEKTVQKKMADYAKSIDEKSAELLQAYKDAETEDEKKKAKKAYIRFYRQVVKSKEFVSLSATVADDLYKANVEASAYINSQTPSIYALNYNYINAEMANDIDGFTPQEITESEAEKYSGYTQQTVDKKKDTAWNNDNLKKSVLAGSLLLLGAYAIMKRSANSAVEKNRNSANMHSEGMVTDAENKARLDGMYRASDIGVKVQKQWRSTLDNRTRDSHRLLDGETIDLDATFDNGLKYPREPGGRPEEVYNCFVGETKVASDSDVVRSYKHKYDGKIISIKTAGGVQFSCTPNHPILTPRGWVAAELLKNRDNILVTHGENNVFSRVNPDVKHRFPRIDAIHKFGKKMRGQRTCGLSVNFHGDVATSNVEIVTQKRLLGNVRYSSGRNGIDKFLLKLSNKTLSSLGSLFEHFRSICKSPLGFICRECKSLPFFKCGIGHSCEHGFGTVANRNIILAEYSINDLPADTVIDGELLDRLSCKVFLDTIVSVDVSVLSTHVYNLQTENGYYFVNSIIQQDTGKSNGIFAIAKNCRCRLRYVTPYTKYETRSARLGEVKGSYKKDSSFRGTKSIEIENMSYAEWMEWRKRNGN